MQHQFLHFAVINVWTTAEQKNSKVKNRQNEEVNRLKINSSGGSSSNSNNNNNAASYIGQGKYTHNSSLALNKLSNQFANHLHISNDQAQGSSLALQQQQQQQQQQHQHYQLASDKPTSYFHRTFAQSHHHPSSNALANQSDSHNNYVEIDTLEYLYQQQQSDPNDNFPQQYSNAPTYELNNYAENNQAQSQQQQQQQQQPPQPLDIALSSPIYENQAVAIRRSESPIYSNTNPSITSLYSNSQNLYSNLPSGIQQANGLVPTSREFHKYSC
jgi:hypothetical protein